VSGAEHERVFELFGSEVRLLIGSPREPELPPPAFAALQLEAFLRTIHRRLTRFEGNSDLSIMNAAPARACVVSPLLALAVRAGLWAAEVSGGLVDPTLVGELERAGYRRSRAGLEPARLADALAAAPPRRPARPCPAARWRRVEVDQARAVVSRPPGIRFDSGGTGKGLAADLAASRLAGYATFAVDCGGDVRVGGEDAILRQVEIEDPLSNEAAHSFALANGAVATSGVSTRLWRTESGFAHHLIDPFTGEPAWTGIVQATACGATALEAETLAKLALLSGPVGGRAALERCGGVLIHDDGRVEVLGSSRISASVGQAAAARRAWPMSSSGIGSSSMTG
jgi:thiamine biosynthesis lipoprotein